MVQFDAARSQLVTDLTSARPPGKKFEDELKDIVEEDGPEEQLLVLLPHIAVENHNWQFMLLAVPNATCLDEIENIPCDDESIPDAWLLHLLREGCRRPRWDRHGNFQKSGVLREYFGSDTDGSCIKGRD